MARARRWWHLESGGGEEEREDELGPEEQNPTAVWETDSVDEEAKENTSFKARPGRAD